MAVGIATKSEPGQICLWRFYDLDRGRLVPCGNLHTLLWFLASPGTREASVNSLSSVGMPPSMTVELTGPEADDRRHLRVSFQVRQRDVLDPATRLSEEERSLFYQRLEEFNGQLNPKIYEILGRPALPGQGKPRRLR
jgi:hypothetical protein